MKIGLLICALLILGNTVLLSQTSACKKAGEVAQTINRYHYKPRSIDDAFSELVFDHLLTLLDEENLIFSNQDFEKLSIHRLEIDDQLQNNSCEFLIEITWLYDSNLSYLDSLYSLLKFSEYDINSRDSVDLRFKGSYLEREELNKLIKQRIQLEVLDEIINDDSSITKNPDLIIRFNKELKNIIESKKCELKTRFNQKTIEEIVGEAYLQSICYAFDPHSAYLPHDRKELLSDKLSDNALSFGFGLYPGETGYIKVVSLSPGGAAWNSNLINEGDLLLSVKGNNISLNLKCISWLAFMEFMQNPKLKEATFSVKKRNNETVSVFLSKEPIQVSTNIIRSFILESDNQKIGYLYLPSFYGDISENGIPLNGCANDIAKELIKLKKENIDGLIFDLRDNPGGYMMEALKLAGIFVDYGALAIAQSTNEEPQTLKDPTRGISYNGPMVVLVNGYSASASELFAAAMQDQNRAVIAGASTFGKATMQNIFPLEDSNGTIQTDDFVKVTLGKFYRVTGKSHQNQGVIVDVSIPSKYDAVTFSESDYSSSLENSEIKKKTYYYPQPELPLEELRKNCKSRVDTSAVFQNIMKIQRKHISENSIYKLPLGIEALRNYYKLDDEKSDKLKISSKAIFETRKPSHLEEIFDLDKGASSSVMENINSDESVKEAYRILRDLINSK